MARTAGTRLPGPRLKGVKRRVKLAPWVATPREIVAEALSFMGLSERDRFVDLGCGDGRVVIYASKYLGARSLCVELDEDLCVLAELNIARNGVSGLAEVQCVDLFEVPLYEFTAVYIYMFKSVNELIAPKLEAELPLGARILTLDFPVPGWIPARVKRLVDGAGIVRALYSYIRGVSDPGSLVKAVRVDADPTRILKVMGGGARRNQRR
ncbi:TPA: class I SAM-dependent methyltransferase [Candidatus Micrarchaeota archaeon]|nr:class I SAM-dependent methyltransferase [Candidatus Micrarchaeota archaeon]